MLSRERDHRIGHRKTVRQARVGGGEGDFFRQVGKPRLLHRCHGVESIVLGSLTLDPLMNLVHGDRRRDHVPWRSQARAKLGCMRAIGEELGHPEESMTIKSDPSSYGTLSS